jgi:D-Ala-teichoic acid biosynthesis protein.
MIERSMRFIATVSISPRIRFVALTAYYLAVLIAMLLLWTRAGAVTPSFVYQEF